MKKNEYIKMEHCLKGHLYRVHSRNLSLAVYDGDEGFIGIRTKFKDRYLFTEYHYDQGAPFGTVFPLEEIEKLPDGIEAVESYGPFHAGTDRKVAFGGYLDKGGKGWFYLDTGEASQKIDPRTRQNAKLFDYLERKMNDGTKTNINQPLNEAAVNK